jgi:hypothetical protein
MTEPPSSRRSGNRIGPAGDRAGDESVRSTVKGDVPRPILDRYLIERDLRGRAERFYRDHRSPELAFRDTGRRLTSDHPYPDIVADMLKISHHRGWTKLRVEGDEAFRREVWIQARAQGMDVSGYRPRDRDRQAAGRPDERAALKERLRRAAAVVRALVPDPATRRRLLDHAVGLIDRPERRPELQKLDPTSGRRR